MSFQRSKQFIQSLGAGLFRRQQISQQGVCLSSHGTEEYRDTLVFCYVVCSEKQFSRYAVIPSVSE